MISHERPPKAARNGMMKTVSLWLFAALVVSNGYIACSNAPQYEGGGRHIDTVVNSTGTSNLDASDVSSPDVQTDTSMKDTSAPPDTSLGGG